MFACQRLSVWSQSREGAVTVLQTIRKIINTLRIPTVTMTIDIPGQCACIYAIQVSVNELYYCPADIDSAQSLSDGCANPMLVYVSMRSSSHVLAS
jgi:hypothetical protein